MHHIQSEVSWLSSAVIFTALKNNSERFLWRLTYFFFIRVLIVDRRVNKGHKVTYHSLKVNDFSHFKARKLWKSFHSSQSRPPRHHAYVSLGVDHAPFGQRPHVLVLWYQFSSGFPTIAAMGEFGIRLSQPRMKQSSNLTSAYSLRLPYGNYGTRGIYSNIHGVDVGSGPNSFQIAVLGVLE